MILMYVRHLNDTFSISRRYLIKPYGIDEICYSIYNAFKDKAVSIAYEKPTCSHIFVVGSNYEIRLFISPSLEVHLNVLADIRSFTTPHIFKSIQKIFNDIDKLFSKLSYSTSCISLAVRSSFKIRGGSPSDLEELLKSLGIAVYARDFSDISGIGVVVIRGKTFGRNLKQYEVVVSLLQDGVNTDITASVETESSEEDIVEQLADMQNTLYSIVEHLTAKRPPRKSTNTL